VSQKGELSHLYSKGDRKYIKEVFSVFLPPKRKIFALLMSAPSVGTMISGREFPY